MKYAAKPDRELSDTPWSKAETILIQKFLTAIDRREFIAENPEWLPVKSTLPELKRLHEEPRAGLILSSMPWPIRAWASPKSKESWSLEAHLKRYRDDK